RYSWLTMIFDKVIAMIDSFRVIRSTTVYLLVLFFSIIMWTFMYLTYFAVVRAFHLELDLSQVLFLFLIMWPVSLLPIKGVLNLGTFEGGWVLGLFLLGLTESTGIAVAFGAHTILFMYVVGVLIFPLILYSSRFTNNLSKNSAIMQQLDKLS
ncbi:MAG: lysylphosphatidylglycerol synthase domain-containing protein, partial [Pseudomonadota bacterium]|nr:lysylphosphatidylglycerol synthase domain-containing protein [Pseudomonadota bacterium]